MQHLMNEMPPSTESADMHVLRIAWSGKNQPAAIRRRKRRPPAPTSKRRDVVPNPLEAEPGVFEAVVPLEFGGLGGEEPEGGDAGSSAPGGAATAQTKSLYMGAFGSWREIGPRA
jgi:hypothetical protein